MRESENIFSFQDGSNRENEFFRDMIRGMENYEELWDMPLDGICYSQNIIPDPDKQSYFSDTIDYLSKKIVERFLIVMKNSLDLKRVRDIHKR